MAGKATESQAPQPEGPTIVLGRKGELGPELETGLGLVPRHRSQAVGKTLRPGILGRVEVHKGGRQGCHGGQGHNRSPSSSPLAHSQ